MSDRKTAHSDTPDLTRNIADRPWFFCGIGGSGMLPLAQILKARGAEVAGSDRSFDQGLSPQKFAALERQGFVLHPQDGSGMTGRDQVLIASAAVEDSVPEVARASELGCERMSRAELLAALFNDSETAVAIGGTSGKSTVTAMLGWVLADNDKDPTVMNGAVMKNFQTPDHPYASARIADGTQNTAFVSEVDESDGSIALYRPAIGVLLNVSLDHKSMDELRALFGDYLAASGHAVVNADDDEAFRLIHRAQQATSFGVENGCATVLADKDTIVEKRAFIEAEVTDRRADTRARLVLNMPGRHNLANALAAIAAAGVAGVPLAKAVDSLSRFKGLARRFDVIGTTHSAITIIDDFGHNPEKCAATLRTLRAQPGRVLVFFQPHGYGPLRQMGEELAETFARELEAGDVVIFSDPVYHGGTVDRSEGSERIVRMIEKQAGNGVEAIYLPERKSVADRLIQIAGPGDRIVIMGARDDTLTDFAKDLLVRLS